MADRSTREQSRRRIEVAFAFAEDVVYAGIALLLVVAAGVLLVVAGGELLEMRDGLSTDPIVEVLDTLLLVFIIVELLSAVRVTVLKRELVAEPFLLVGIIASIKEIVVLSVKAADAIGSRSMISCGSSACSAGSCCSSGRPRSFCAARSANRPRAPNPRRRR